LNSVSKIKNFLTAGDNATGSKSAMIYTFLSTNQTNPNGSALNLFAVTTTDVIYKTIPLINGQYQKLVAGQYQNFDLDTTITDFRSEVKSTGTNENGEFLYFLQAADLYDVLFRPLKSALSQVDNLVFSTDNLFRTIPFAALYDNRTSDNDGTMHLVEKYSSSIAPSFQVIEKSRYTSLKSANVLKMGAREFSGGWDPLPSARTELENIARIESQNAPTVKHSPVYMNKQFSKNNLKTFIAKNDAPIIHLATHGKYVGDSQSSYVPSQSSYIALGTNTPNGFDGLTQAELRQLQDLRNKDLLVFSACDTLVGGGGGMAGAALVAGVKSAIGCRWVVSDEATMVTMTGFYQQLLGNGLSKTKALQEAQKAMILGKVQVTDVAGTTDRAELSIDGNKVTSSDYGQKNIKAQLVNPNRLNHPLYWAAFSLVGNPW
jgi:CHAT domain-containing protein